MWKAHEEMSRNNWLIFIKRRYYIYGFLLPREERRPEIKEKNNKMYLEWKRKHWSSLILMMIIKRKHWKLKLAEVQFLLLPRTEKKVQIREKINKNVPGTKSLRKSWGASSIPLMFVCPEASASSTKHLKFKLGIKQNYRVRQRGEEEGGKW